MPIRRDLVLILASACLLVLMLGALAGCGPTPYPTPTPSLTPRPTSSPYPTFTPTAVNQPPGADVTRLPATSTPAQSTRRASSTPSPTTQVLATPLLETPTPAATRATGPVPRLSGQILFPAFDVERQMYDIYRLDLVSGELEVLLAEASQPALDSEGAQVAFRSWQPDLRGLVVRALKGGDPWRLTEFTEAARPRWSPEGERFLFFGRQEPDRQARIYLFTGRDAAPVVEIRRDGSPILGTTPAWLPDGRVVYQGCYRDKCGLSLINLDGTGSTVLVEDTTAVAPDVSPDGAQIVFMSKQGGYWQVNLVNVDGTGWRRLTDDWYWNGLPVWSPDGRYIAFVSTRDENWPDTFVPAENRLFSLWVMEADGSAQRQLNPFVWVLDGVPGTVPGHEHGGWVEEAITWAP